MSLCIIITGLVRNLFNKEYNSFYSLDNLIKTSASNYKQIHIIMVISGEYNGESMDKFIKELNDMNITVEILTFQMSEITPKQNRLQNSQDYLNLKQKHFGELSHAIKEIPDPGSYLTKSMIQFYQLKKGIENMFEFENNNGIKFDVCMRTRFDIIYSPGFFPGVHEKNASIMQKICFNYENYLNLKSRFSNIDDINGVINHLKHEKIILPECRTHYRNYSFGGAYLNNYISLENILNGSTDILYMYNDYVIFGDRENFIKLKDFYDVFGELDTSLNITHYFASESQLLIYCFNNNINPLMYLYLDGRFCVER